MNPHVYGGSMSAESMIYEPLVRNTKDGIKPLLAKKWDIYLMVKHIRFI